MRRCRDDDETLSSKMNNDSHRKQLKNLSADDKYQEKKLLSKKN